MGEKQRETLEWLEELERYAKERQLSMRILDSIEDCKKSAASENVNWNQTDMQIEELLDSIEKKVLPAVVQVEEGGNEVSVAMVEDELKNMARRCHAENETSVYNFENRKNIIIRGLFLKLQDITRVKAHLKEMKNENAYQIFFQRAKAEYHNNIMGMVRELLQSVRSNHEQMMERMKSMLQSIKAYKHGLGSERLYREYDTRAAGVDNRIKGEIEQMETGEEEILDFARKTRETVGPIVGKLERKKKMLAWLPVIIILCVFLAGAAVTYITALQAAEEAEEAVGIREEDVMKIVNMVMGPKESDKTSVRGVIIKAIFYIMVAALIYGLYLTLLNQWCNRQICNKCGVYLNAELEDFGKNNTLLPRMNDMINAAMEEYERQYAGILNELLEGSSFDPESTEKKEADQFSKVKNSWNTIKYR